MPQVQISISDDAYDRLQAEAERRGLPLEALIEEGTHEDPHLLALRLPTAWMPLSQWDRLVTGGEENCPMCAAIKYPQDVDEYGITILEMPAGRLRLSANQYAPGYCVLICNMHAREFYELPPDVQRDFFEDLAAAGHAIELAMRRAGLAPVKMNFSILGNAIPHVHAHIVPRYVSDDAPHAPLPPNFGTAMLDDDELLARAAAIREVLLAT